MSFKYQIFSFITSLRLTVSIITPTTIMKHLVIPENVIEKLSECIPHVDDMIEREHRVELLRLYDKNLGEKECYEGDVGSGLVELIMEAKMMREENNFYIYQGSLSFKDDRNEIQRILLGEMSFTNSGNNQDLLGERWRCVSSFSSSDNNHNVSGECL